MQYFIDNSPLLFVCFHFRMNVKELLFTLIYDFFLKKIYKVELKKEKFSFFFPHDKKKWTKTVEKIISGGEKGTLTFWKLLSGKQNLIMGVASSSGGFVIILFFYFIKKRI